MAVCWKCPVCDNQVCDTRPVSANEVLSCSRCESQFMRSDTRCIVCDSQDSLVRRDSLHYWCTSCGHMQALWSLSA